MPKIWTDITLVPEALAKLAGKADLFGPGTGAGGDALRGIEGAEGAVSASQVQWNDSLFKRAKALKVVARSGIGMDNVDLAAATAHGVCGTNTPQSPTEGTAEFAITLMLAVARKLCLADRRMRTEGWIPGSQVVGFELAGKTLGLVGLGRIGARVAEIARALRMTVIAYDPLAKPEVARAHGVELVKDLRAILSRADVVSLHIPMSAENRGLIGAAELATMKKGAVLINAARGPIVVQSALAAALASGHLGGAGLDVWESEPITRDNPLLKLDNLVGAPHVAGNTVEALRLGNVGAVESILMVLSGERPPNLVNADVWDRRR